MSVYYITIISDVLAVKFGRMSKKQRERVEEEAVFHKRNRLNGYDAYENLNNNQYTTAT